MTTSTPARSKRPIWMFLIILLVFGIPLMTAWIGWEEQDNFGRGTTNHGQLIQPPLDFTKLALTDADGRSVPTNIWQGKWLLLYVSPQRCDSACEKQVYYLGQIRKATGKNSDRVQRALLTFSQTPADSALTQALQQPLAGTLHFISSNPNFADFVHNTPQAATILQQGGVYIVDPLGNVMMYYPPNADPMGIFKDLTRLLKLSHIG